MKIFSTSSDSPKSTQPALKYARRYAVSPAHFSLAALILDFARLGPNIFNTLSGEVSPESGVAEQPKEANHFPTWCTKPPRLGNDSPPSVACRPGVHVSEAAYFRSSSVRGCLDGSPEIRFIFHVEDELYRVLDGIRVEPSDPLFSCVVLSELPGEQALE